MARRPVAYAEGIAFDNRVHVESVVFQSPVYAESVVFQTPDYAEGVVFHSPGSRRGEAAERTLGYASHNTHIRRRRYTNDDNDNPRPIRSRGGTTTFSLCNAFSVWDVCCVQSPRVRRERRFRRIAATLGFGM